MGSVLGHEKLRVYQRALDYASWTHAVLAGIEPSVAALDHWDRAAESIVENVANGNSRHAAADRNRYFDVAFGSALECAACPDICVCKKLISVDQQIRFLDIAHTSAMRVAACLDLLVARRHVKVHQIEDGKQILARIVPLLLGLRGYLDEQTDQR